jgi:restriction endonuclease S subunit
MQQKKMPVLRFAPFADEWVSKKLGEVAPLQRGFDLPVHTIIEGNYPVVFSNGILKYHHQFKVKAPGVVTGRSGTIGKVTFVENDYWPHNTALWVTDFKGNCPRFIYYFYVQFNLERFSTGSGVPTLNRNDVHSEAAMLPTLPEQQKIGSFFAAIDTRITQLKKQQLLLDAYKKGVTQQIFTQIKRFKAEQMDFPDWQETHLGLVCEIRSGLSKEQKEHRNGLKVTRIETISDGIINWSKIGFIDVVENIEDYKLRKGDILFSNINSVAHIGKMAIADSDLDLYHGMNLLCLRSLSDVNPFFLYHYLNSAAIRRHFKMICNQAINQASINQTELAKTQILLPCFAEQTQIANFLSAIDAKRAAVRTQIAQTEVWKKGLLQQMFME